MFLLHTATKKIEFINMGFLKFNTIRAEWKSLLTGKECKLNGLL